MELGMNINPSGRGDMQMQQRLSPPVASTIEEAVKTSMSVSPRIEIDEAKIERIRIYLGDETREIPFSDRRIQNYMKRTYADAVTPYEISVARALK